MTASSSSKPRVLTIGCGIVGAAIAYELGRSQQFDVTVLEERSGPPAIAPGATAAYGTGTPGALGVLMGAISQKTEGRGWMLREASLRRFQTLIPELESLTGTAIFHNEYGVLKVFGQDGDLAQWEALADLRKAQGWRLEILGADAIAGTFPQVSMDALGGLSFGVHSRDDWQVQPVSLAATLVEGAQHYGVEFRFGTTVQALETTPAGTVVAVTDSGRFEADWVTIAAGLGSGAIAGTVGYDLPLRGVLGQAARLRLDRPMAMREPALSGNDVHVVPLGGGNYWVGATVEFPDGDGFDPAAVPPGNPEAWATVLATAQSLCPDLRGAEVVQRWSGLRPRPDGRGAPVIERLPQCDRVWVAAGHYRNGVLLAPATAEAIAAALRQAAVG